MASGSYPRTIGSVEKTCKIIDLLEERGSIGVSELADELGLTKGTAYCYLASLVKHDYVIKQDGKYCLSLRYLKLGQTVTQQIDEYDLVVDELTEIAEELGERAQFNIEQGGYTIYVARQTTKKAVKSSISVGGKEYLHCVSGGKAMLAHFSDERIEEIVDQHGLKQYTKHTITNREDLWAELEAIRDQGYAIHDEERVRGVRCLAVPILSDGSTVAGAISVCGPVSRMPHSRLENEVLERIRKSVNLIEVNSQLPYGGV